jgi:pyruvate/2-oxoglutarate dehydrogenase complex dihydrolipoamide acyltransferase (E2) component
VIRHVTVQAGDADQPGDGNDHRMSSAAATRKRRVEVRRFPTGRRLVTAAERAGRRMAPMHGFVDLDVTDARRLLAADPPLSFTAFLVACVARAAATHPEVHAYRDWRGRLVLHHHADVATLVEIETPEGLFALPHVLRDADVRDVADLTAELRTVKAEPRASGSGRMLARFGTAATRVPGLVPTLYGLMSRTVRMRRMTGTVAVSAVGMFAAGGGFGVAPPTLMSLQVIVGGVSRRPRVVDARIEVREVLDLTITVDHNVVDGAPAARFGADLRRLIESADVLQKPERRSPSGA